MRDGGTVRRTYVAELGSDEFPGVKGALRGGEYLGRAVCTRCVPKWRGPVRSLSRYIGKNPTAEPERALVAVRDKLRADVLRHCDRVHGGATR